MTMIGSMVGVGVVGEVLPPIMVAEVQMSWELRVWDGKEMSCLDGVGGGTFWSMEAALRAYQNHIRVMPNCPCELRQVSQIQLASHLV